MKMKKKLEIIIGMSVLLLGNMMLLVPQFGPGKNKNLNKSRREISTTKTTTTFFVVHAFSASASSADTPPPHKHVLKHSPMDRVAVFGGNPSKRMDIVSNKLRPYKKLDQYGSPRDVGIGDQKRLCQKILNGSYDVVYLWTRYNNHGSRREIRLACTSTDTRYVETESLAYIAESSDVDVNVDSSNGATDDDDNDDDS